MKIVVTSNDIKLQGVAAGLLSAGHFAGRTFLIRQPSLEGGGAQVAAGTFASIVTLRAVPNIERDSIGR
jgi:hypothetical protein